MSETISEVKRGNRGEVGLGTPGSRLKSLWHRYNKNARKTGGKVSTLKVFLREIKDNPDVKAWKANKAGKNNQKRTEANARRARDEGNATRLSRKKSK